MIPIEQKIADKVAYDRLEDKAAEIAVASARPGPLADVFALQQDIMVGKYKVRPFFDLDFEFLHELEHPFASFAVGNTKELEDFIPRGPKAWQLFYLLTNPVEDVEAQFKAEGADGIRAKAKAEFSRYQLGAMFKLYEATVKQLTVYASSVVGYTQDSAEADKTDDKEASTKAPKG